MILCVNQEQSITSIPSWGSNEPTVYLSRLTRLFFLALWIRISDILPLDRKSYLTHAILPRLSHEGYIHLVVLELTHMVIK